MKIPQVTQKASEVRICRFWLGFVDIVDIENWFVEVEKATMQQSKLE